MCHSLNSDYSLNCDSNTYPRGNGAVGDIMPVRFNGTYNLAVTIRVYNHAGNKLVHDPYRAELHASSRDWVVTHDTGYLPAVGDDYETTDWVTHTWYNNHLEKGDSLTLSLMSLSREESSFWPDFSLQFQRIRLTMNTSFDPAYDATEALNYESWLYGGESPPPPPPPPHQGAGGIDGLAVEG